MVEQLCISDINMYANYTDIQQLPYSVRECSKRVYTLNFESISSRNSEMWIQMAIKLPHNLGVCQKTVCNLAGGFYRVGERKTLTS